MSGEKPREIAARVLGRRGWAEFIEALLDRALAKAGLTGPDRRLCQELVYGVVRWQATLDWLIARKTGARTQKPALQNLLRLGLYQVFWLESIPNHAAVHETVEMAKRAGFGPQAGFINAVLRGYLREFEPTRQLLADLKVTQPHLGYSHPEWLVKRWQQRWGAEQTGQLMTWNNTPPKTFARVNTLKADAGKLVAQWREEGVEYDFVRADWLEENLVFELKSHPPLARLPSFQQGFFYIQDPSTLLAVDVFQPRPGEAVLDMCAAPGGKLTHIAQQMRNEGRLVAHDISRERIGLIEENCARLGVKQVETVCSGPQTTPKGAFTKPGLPYPQHRKSNLYLDGPQGPMDLNPDDCPPQSQLSLPGEGQLRLAAAGLSRKGLGPSPQFDRVLVDAPCSNTGVMRRRVDLRWRIRPEEITRLKRAQIGLLRQAAPLLKPGGTLIYSTCSLEPEENEEVVAEFLAENRGFQINLARELWPVRDRVDGAYVARIVGPVAGSFSVP